MNMEAEVILERKISKSSMQRLNEITLREGIDYRWRQRAQKKESVNVSVFTAGTKVKDPETETGGVLTNQL